MFIRFKVFGCHRLGKMVANHVLNHARDGAVLRQHTPAREAIVYHCGVRAGAVPFAKHPGYLHYGASFINV